jgi:(p)ppGpp synthase/HD superfamily hydrolase
MTPITERFRRATDLALELHADQRRKRSRVPYVAHLFSVAALAMEHGADEDTAIAALLHDAVEDQGGLATHERIAAEFGDRVAAIVDGCTDGIPDEETGERGPWRARKEAYVERLHRVSEEILLVSKCDKLHNARSILSDLHEEGLAVFDRFSVEKEETLWFYRAVADVARARSDDRLAHELDWTVSEIERMVGAATAP